MNPYEEFALRFHLSNYDDLPVEKGFNYILDMVEDINSEVSVWTPFQDYDPVEVTDMIKSMVDSLSYAFIPREDSHTFCAM
jgi:hypothetical protein